MSDWQKRVRKIQEGDAVAYSKSWLQSTGQFAGDFPHARGTVQALETLSEDVTLAEIAWDREGLPARVNVKNLVRVKDIALE